MKKVYYSVEKEGFYGAYFESKDPLNRCMIAMLGDAIDDRMAVSAVKWLHHRGCNVMTMSPAKRITVTITIRWSGSNEPLRQSNP